MTEGSPGRPAREALAARHVRAGSAEPPLPGPLGRALSRLDARLRRLPPLVALAAILGPFAIVATTILALGALAIVSR